MRGSMPDEIRGALEKLVFGVPEFTSGEIYRSYCMDLIKRYKSNFTGAFTTGQQFKKRLQNIQNSQGHIIQTDWGGVDIVSYEHPNVDKFLVVESGKFLAFEKHEQKVETLLGDEGVGVLIFRPLPGEDIDLLDTAQPALKAEIIEPGWTKTLQPGQEHTIVALSDLLIRETSLDYKGMDQDLIFIYLPSVD